MFELDIDLIIDERFDSIGNGVLIVSISHIHPDWDVMYLKYEIVSFIDGYHLFNSAFELYKKDEESSTNLSNYSDDEKDELRDVIFNSKLYYINKYQPDIIEHFIESNFSFERRFSLYITNINPPGYNFIKASYPVFYIVKSSLLEKLNLT